MSGMKFENQLHQAKEDMNQSSQKVNSRTKHQEFAIPLNKSSLDPNKRQLYLQLLNGKAFLEYMNADQNIPEMDIDQLPGQASSFFNIYVHFRGQRFKTRSFNCACEPKINEGFLLDLNKSGDQLIADSAGLLAITDPLHLVMVRTDLTGESHLIASHFLEWRTVLTYPACKQSLSVELMGMSELRFGSSVFSTPNIYY